MNFKEKKKWGRCRLKSHVKDVYNKNNFKWIRLKIGCRDTHLGNKIIKKCKQVITVEINVVVTFVGLGKRICEL